MKFLNIFKGRLLIFIVLTTGFFSCKKETTESSGPISYPPAVSMRIDSASYTLDGVTYSCNTMYGDEWANRGANLDTSTGVWKWDADTLQYVRSYLIGTSQSFRGSHPGDIKLSFVQKFAKSDLRQTNNQFYSPVSDTLLYYPKGNRPYMMDYYRFNRENGVLLSVRVGPAGPVPIYWTSYATKASALLPPTLTQDSQKDSKFDITNVSFVPGSGGAPNKHAVEARFSCLVFDYDEKPHRVENGYVRILVQ